MTKNKSYYDRCLWIAIWLFILAAFVTMCSEAYAMDLSESDKQKHMAVSAAFGLGTGTIAYFEDGVTWKSGALAWLVAMLPGTGKEIADQDTTGFDWDDMAANAIGATAGVLTGKYGWSIYFSTSEIGVTGRF